MAGLFPPPPDLGANAHHGNRPVLCGRFTQTELNTKQNRYAYIILRYRNV